MLRKQSKRLSIKRNFTWKNSWGIFFILPSLAGVAVFHIVPFISVVQHSFMVAYEKEIVGFKNYCLVMQNGSFQKAAANTGKFLIFCIPILMLFSLWLAFFIGSAKRMRFLKSAALLPLAVPAATMALIWRLLFDENGVMGNVLLGMGKSQIDFFHTSAAFGVLVFTRGISAMTWCYGARRWVVLMDSCMRRQALMEQTGGRGFSILPCRT